MDRNLRRLIIRIIFTVSYIIDHFTGSSSGKR